MADNSNKQNIFQGGKDWNKTTFEGTPKQQQSGNAIFQGGAGWTTAGGKPNKVDDTFQNYSDEKITREQYLYNRNAYGPSLVETVDMTSANYIPKIRVNDKGTGLILSGSKTALESELAKELRAYLKDALSYQNLQSENTAKIIEELNNDIADQIKKSVVENGIGMDYDKYKDYSHAMEVLSSTNPTKKTGDKNKIFGYDKDGNRVAKTPQEWIDYYREKYNSVDRASLFSGSLMLMNQAGTDSPMDPTLWTPYLVMSAGGRSDSPIYGFDLGEKVLAGIKETVNQAAARPIEGLSRGALRATAFVINAGGYGRREHLNQIARDIKMGGNVSSEDLPWLSEGKYNSKLEELKGKTLNSLNKADKSFIAAALSDSNKYTDEIKDILKSGNATVDDIAQYATYSSYSRSRDNLSTIEKYDKEIDKDEGKLKQGRSWLQSEIDSSSIYAPVSVGAGRFVGTMMRYLAESAAISALTGGAITLNQIGDATLSKVGELASRAANGGKFMTTASALTKALSNPFGKFLGAVATEIPEDIIQTAVDNVITGNAEENWTLLTPDSIAENTLQNLIMRGVWQAGASAVRTGAEWARLKQIAKASPLTRNVIIDDIISDAEKVKAASDAGRIAGVTAEGKVKILDEDGMEKVLDNAHILAFREMDDSPILQELARKFMPPEGEATVESIENAKKAVESGNYKSDVTIKIEPLDVDYELAKTITPERYPGFEIDDISKETQNRPFIEALDKNPSSAPSGYNSLKDYYEKAKGQTVSVIEMSPRDYLYNSYRSDMDDWDKYLAIQHSVVDDSNTALYAERMKNGERAPLTYLDYDKNGFAGQEGRHRAVAAQRNGIEKIPVLVRHPVGTDPMDFLIPSKNYVDVTDAFSDYVTVSRYTGDGIIVKKVRDVYRADPTPTSTTINVDDSYRFVEYPFLAKKMDGAVTSTKIDIEKVVSLNETNHIMREATRVVSDSDALDAFIKKYDQDKADIMERISEGDIKAVAEYYERPVVVLEGTVKDQTGLSIRDYRYFPGIDEEFDKQMNTQLLASTTMQTPETDASNIKMANKVQLAIETSPYNKTPAEIIAQKYTMSGPISDAPNSASVKWELPVVEGSYKNIDYAMAAQPTNLTMPEVKEWYYKALNTADQYYQKNIAPEFAAKYPTPTDQQLFVRNMHYLFDLQRMDGLTAKQAVGKTLVDIDGTKLEIRQEDIDFYNEVLAPYMGKLREYSAAGLKIEKPVDIVGYLPHTSYDPMDMTAEEALQQGNLWKTYSGASASTEDGNFTTATLSSDLSSEFNIFARNMIWDSLGEKAIVAKHMSEYHADGIDVKADIVETSVKKQKALSEAMSRTKAAKDLDKELSGNKNIDWKQKNEVDIPEAAKKIGATRAVEQTYSPIYGKARDNGAYSQPSVISLQQTSDVMRKIVTPDGDMYSNGGRMVVAGAADAGYMAKRIFDQANDGHINATEVKQMFTDYLMQNGRRTQKGAEYIADQWMAKIAKDVGEVGDISQRALTARLNSLVYFEGTSRLKRWVARADLNKFNTKTTDWMDEFFYRQGLLSRNINASKTMATINKWTNKLISVRMKSLFWLNFKNGVLQSSECVRIFTEFKMGDALKTIQRLASDTDFRKNVDDWVELLVPERNFSKSAELADIYGDIAKKSKIVDGDISVDKLTKAEENSLFEKIDKAAMTPIDMGENAKNRILIAGILQEAERKGYTGDQLFNFVNKKFERIGLANNDLGRLAGADNPLFRIATNLKSFSIRQFGMYINNIKDMNGGEAVGYIIKNLGWKIGVATILAKLGYSVPQSLGIDPFDILDDDYTGVDEDDYNALDKVIAGPAGRALLSGGFTSYLADAYWAARQAYENKIATPADEVDRKFEERGIFELAMPDVSFDNMLNIGAGFIPGYTQGKRVLDMADLQNSGWAVSATGNMMYAAPDNAFDTATGYIFGRSNTPNARTYYQTADPLQGLIEGGIPGFNQQFFGRGFNLGGGFRNFDPIDSRNYSDWFYGDTRDDQQWNVGYYYFREQAQKLQDEYQNALRNSYDDDSRNAVYNSYNSRLRELDDSIARFVQAYQAKNPGKFDANKMNNVLTVMRTYQPDLNADELQRNEQFFDANDNALQRYVAAGLPQTVSYKYVEDKEHPEKSGTQVEYSPQVRAAMQGRYGLPEEASRLIKQVYNDKWKDLNKEYRDKYYGTKNSREKKAIQAEYFNLVRKDLDPIVALYGAEIFSNDTVDDVMEDVFNSMAPYGTSVKKYLQGKYKNYMSGTIQYSQPGNETITEIRGLLDQGKTARGKALARTLLQRVQENRQALTREELEWLQGVLND